MLTSVSKSASEKTDFKIINEESEWEISLNTLDSIFDLYKWLIVRVFWTTAIQID